MNDNSYLSENTLRFLDESLEHDWDQTIPDSVSDANARALRLAEAISGGMDARALVKTIFNNTKGAPLESVFDPRVSKIKALIDHRHKLVRLACCWAVLGQGIYSPKVDNIVGGVDNVADLAVNSHSSGVRHDAVTMLDRLRSEFPESRPRIDHACLIATRKFLANHADLLAANDYIAKPQRL
jgi:hypothetical protein